ncbi:hypothetical protein C0995_009131 [Termitomyces sp. Mi166|nr:hypothetical protein C0995_009131 [Termitomyces sp. Mi166\
MAIRVLDAPPSYSEPSSPGSSTSQIFEPHEEEALPPYSNAPRYSAVFALHGRPIQGCQTSHPLETEHSFALRNDGIPWVKLKCISRAASPSETPKFVGGDNIAGSILLYLASSTYISSITISVKGRIITSGAEEGSYIFLDKTHTVWSKAHGNPRHASSTQNIKHKGNLDPGEYSWSFSFPFPATFDYSNEPGSAGMKSYRTPQSVSERHTPATVQYELFLHIGRGALRPDKNITVPILYTPKIIPDPPSLLRELSYRNAMPLVGPSEDPVGWTTLPAVTICPRLLDTQQSVKVECQLSLANPMCYARGSVIPCWLTLQSDSPAGLDALADSKAIKVALQRRVKYHPKGLRCKPITQTTTIQSAVWWPSNVDQPSEGPNIRIMEGELHLSKSLQSTSDFPPFSVKYIINWFDFQSPAIHPKDGVKITLLTQTITIGTFSASGPQIREYSARKRDGNPPRCWNIEHTAGNHQSFL